jgi:hypothetical protein
MGRGPTLSKIGAMAARNASPGVVARIGPTRPSPRATRLNAFPCPAGMPTAAWTSSCARMAAICAGMASGACARSGRMKISKWPSALKRLSQHSPIALAFAPLLVKPIATRTRRAGGFQRLEQRSHARRHPLSQLSRFPASSSLLPSNRLSGDGHAIGRNTDAQERRREGAAGFDGGGAAAAQRGTAPSNPVAGREGRDRLSPQGRRRAGARRHWQRDPLAISPPPCGSSPWAKTACGLGERSVGPRCRAAAGANRLRTPKAKELELMSPFDTPSLMKPVEWLGSAGRCSRLPRRCANRCRLAA